MYLYESAALKWFDRRSERSPIHCEQGSYGAHLRRLGSIQRHQERELPVRQLKGPECFIKMPGQNSCGTLCVKTETIVSDQDGCLVWQRCFCT